MNYQNEQDLMFKYILNNSVFNHYNKNDKNELGHLELIITPECNLNCSYCYLNKNKDVLYPKNIRNNEQILKNLDILLNFFLQKDLFIHSLQLYSGEIWSSEFGLNILKILLEKNIQKTFCKKIIIPSNMSFLLDDKAKKNIEKLMNDFKQYGIILAWSASIDGKIIEDQFRPFNDTSLLHSDYFYNEVFEFSKRHPTTGFHPMVSSKSCKYWIENYKWFEEQFKIHFDENYEYEPMMLEVRNPDWTEEDIEYYKKFLEFLIINQKEKSSSMQEFAQRIFKYGDFKTTLYTPYNLRLTEARTSCSLTNTLFIRLGDLSIVPCHRLSYDNLLLGQFSINENNKIDSIQAKNSDLFLYLKTLNPRVNMLKCERCKYNYLCIKGCLGAQYEQHQHLNYPCENICNLLQNKIKFLIKIYKREGLIEQLEKDSTLFPELKSIITTLKGMESVIDNE